MKLIITGGAGFIGSNYIHFSMENNNDQILNIDKLSYSGTHYFLDKYKNNANYNFVKEDLCNAEAIKTILDEFQPEGILHFAAESHVDRSIDGPKAFVESNIIGTFNLLEAFRGYYYSINENVREKVKFIHISTDEVYGSLSDDDLPASEQNKYYPNSPYSASKAASDHLVNAWYHTYKLPLITTNCSNNFGPYQFPEKLIPLMINKAITNNPLPVYGDGNNIRNWIYVNDHVRALNLVLHKGNIGEIYNVGNNYQITNLELVEKICDILDELKPAQDSYKKQIEFVADRPGHDYRYDIDSSKICSELGWEIKDNFDDALKKTIIWYLENQDWCEKVFNEKYDGKRLGLDIV